MEAWVAEEHLQGGTGRWIPSEGGLQVFAKALQESGRGYSLHDETSFLSSSKSHVLR
jgi:hypothetical protein